MKCIIGAWANTKCTRPVSSFILALRITVFVLLNFMAVPLGALGFFYLATQEAKGNGYRVIA